jgi:hypothetical protein
MPVQTRRLTAMAFVADVARSVEYYRLLGFGVSSSFTPPGTDRLNWVWLESADANLMLSRASHPVDADKQAVLFYLYVDDIPAAHAELTAAGLNPGPIETRFYAPQGEFRLIDPDGFVLMVTHT